MFHIFFAKDKESDRKKLLDEKTEELNPRKRTPDEIKAPYGHKEDLVRSFMLYQRLLFINVPSVGIVLTNGKLGWQGFQ